MCLFTGSLYLAFFLPTVYLPHVDSSPALVQQSTHLFLSTVSSRRPLSFLLLGVGLPRISNDLCYYRAQSSAYLTPFAGPPHC